MNIGELFVKIGVKGDGGAKKALKGTQDGLSDIKSMSLEAKAAILGVIYGLQRMMSSSVKGGQDLANFAALTGQSTDALQRYQYAGKLVGVTNDSMTSTFVNLQKAAASVDIDGEAFQSLGGISQMLARGGEQLDINKFKTDIPYAMQMLQKFAQLDNSVVGGLNPEGFKNNLLSKMGIGDDVIAAMKRDAFTPKNLNAAPINSAGQIKALANIDAQWTRVMAKIDKLIDGLIVQFGPEVMKQIEIFIGVAVEVIKSVAKLVLAMKPMENISKGVETLKNPSKIFKGMAQAGPSGTMRAMNRVFGLDEALDSLGNGIGSLGADIVKDARLMELRKAQGEYEARYGNKGKSGKDDGMIIEEQINNNTSNLYFEIPNADPREVAEQAKRIFSKEVGANLNLIPTRSYGP